ncbi:MAG: alpha/beta hydrolase [Actinobacteria bacterium]|nr:alpha/beta hydrolase [Actinomycetota bacterium]
MSAPTVTQALGWRPGVLSGLADTWDAGARALLGHLEDAAPVVEVWSGPAAQAARARFALLATGADELARVLVSAAAELRDGAARITEAVEEVRMLVTAARAAGYVVTDEGVVYRPDPAVTTDGPADLTERLRAALAGLGEADADTAARIDGWFAAGHRNAGTVPAGVGPFARSVGAAVVVDGWPSMGQADIAGQIAAMTPAQRAALVDAFPQQVGNTDGVPWDLRVAANRRNIAQAIAAERGDDPLSRQRAAFYRTLLDDVEDPARGGGRVPRQILAFDPARASLVELNGDLVAARSVAVLVPGLNTTMEGSASVTATARRFVWATRGEAAVITYLGGPFPRGNPLTGLLDAADPRYALDMAPRLVAFSEDVDRTVDALDGAVPVTYIGHSYGGSILGTGEALGLTADRTLYVAAAGAGVGVDDPGDWHNRNPHVLRFSMTAPGDFIEAVQGIPGGPHGADPDEMPGVIRLPTGRYDDGRLMAGWPAHSDILNWPSDSWRAILAVITGDSATLHQAG